MNFFKEIAGKISYAYRYLKVSVKKTVKFFTFDIWHFSFDDVSAWKSRLVRDAKTLMLMMNTFSTQKIGFQATALSYQSTMAIVPFLAIAFYLTGGLGLSDKLTEFLHENISNEGLIEMLTSASDNILTTAQSGLFGFLSMLTFVWIVIWLMICVRRVFNNVWKVPKESNFLKMIGVVFGIIILSPFVIILFFSGTIVYSHVLDLLVPSKVAFSEHIKSVLSWVIFGAISILIISVMYKGIPGCKVRYRHAFRAAVFSGIVFTLLQVLYLETQVMVAKQSAVYGAVAALPLFMIWLNFGWTVILYGAELSYAMQEMEKSKLTNEQLDEFRREARRDRRHYTDASDIIDQVEQRNPNNKTSR